MLAPTDSVSPASGKKAEPSDACRLLFKDTVKRNIQKMDIGKSTWQKKAKSRDDWKSLICPK